MTSNIGAQYTRSSSLGFSADDKSSNQAGEERVMRALREAFRPEFLDRIDECIYFSPLSPQSIGEICKRQLNQLASKLSLKDIKLSFSPEAVEFICESAKTNGGARHIRRRISRLCERTISEKILSGEITKGSKIALNASEDSDELDIVIQ
jgi:ATP-dependent Clp protease ATP-binding subunit ClpC